ncbi:putative ribonuclease H-like domain-containing protein [Tanacetum coccineum]
MGGGRGGRVEENLHIRFLENKPMIEGNGPKWLFDIDSLTQSMNYVPVTAGTISNESAGTQGEFSAVNTVGPSINTASSYDQNSSKDMFTIGASHSLKATHVEFFSEEEELEVDMGNIINSYTVPTTPNTRIHKDHPIENVIGDVKTSVQRRRMTKPTSEQGFLSAVYEQKTHDTLNTCLYACFLSQIEPQALLKPYLIHLRVESLPKNFYNSNFNSTKIMVYVGDIIFGFTKKELCTGFEKLIKEKFQMSSMGELTFFLGLQVQQKEDGIFISQDKYVAEILKKFNYTDVKSASTLVDLEKPLVKDGDADDVDVHLYRSMIGFLMYLTASRPDIIYLKGKPTLGLWYSRDSPFELVAYTDSDYAGATQDRKSTTGGCQFLGNRLISWQCKKQTVVATSTTEAEYVAAASCCGQSTKIDNSTASEAITTADVEDSAVPTIPTTIEETLAQTLMEIKVAKPKPKAKGIVFHDLEKQVSKPTVSFTQPSIKDKGKGIMQEPERPLTKKFKLLLMKICKGKSYDEIQKLFDKEMKRVNTFVAMSSEAQESNEKKVEGSEEKAKSSRKKSLVDKSRWKFQEIFFNDKDASGYRQRRLRDSLEVSQNKALADKQSGRPSRSLPSNTQPNPKGHNSKAYQPSQSRNEHVNVKQLNLGVGTERMIFNIDSTMKHSYSNNDTCFSIDVIDEILEEYFNALLDEGSKILHSIKGTLHEEEIFSEFDEFMALTADENSHSDTEDPPFEKITINTDYKIKTSLEEPPTDLELKPLLDNLEYVFLE